MIIKTASPKFVIRHPDFDRLRQVYTEESGVPLWGNSTICLQDYKDTKFVAMLEGETLAGFSCVRTIRHPHYAGKIIASMDAIFIDPAFRQGPAGLKLLNKTKELAASLGADTLVMTAPYGSRLASMLRLITRDNPVSETFCLKTPLFKEEKHEF